MKSTNAHRLLVTGLIVIATIALIVLEAGTPPARRLAPVPLLINVFEKVVFHYEDQPQFEVKWVRKWDAVVPVVILFEGEIAPSNRRMVADHANDLAMLTGLKVAIADDLPSFGKFAVIRIRFGPWRDLPAFMRKLYPGQYLDDEKTMKSMVCAASQRLNRFGFFHHSSIYITTDYGTELIRHCLLEEMTQSLGFPNDVDLIPPSMFGEKGSGLELTLNDKILVRTLYDERIVPGMSKAEAMKVARRVIAELVAAVRERGEAALVHPLAGAAAPSK